MIGEKVSWYQSCRNITSTSRNYRKVAISPIDSEMLHGVSSQSPPELDSKQALLGIPVVSLPPMDLLDDASSHNRLFHAE